MPRHRSARGACPSRRDSPPASLRHAAPLPPSTGHFRASSRSSVSPMRREVPGDKGPVCHDSCGVSVERSLAHSRCPINTAESRKEVCTQRTNGNCSLLHQAGRKKRAGAPDARAAGEAGPGGGMAGALPTPRPRDAGRPRAFGSRLSWGAGATASSGHPRGARGKGEGRSAARRRSHPDQTPTPGSRADTDKEPPRPEASGIKSQLFLPDTHRGATACRGPRARSADSTKGGSGKPSRPDRHCA